MQPLDPKLALCGILVFDTVVLACLAAQQAFA